MTTQLDVVNAALNELGFPAVTVLNENPASELLTNKSNLLLPELLLSTDWNFAIKFVEDNTPLTTLISPDYQYNYQLPADYNRMDRFSWQFNNGAFGFYYRIIDGVIMTNSRPILYYYVVNDADYSVLTPLFADALALFIAARSSTALTNKEALTKYLFEIYRDKLNAAILQNDMDRYVQSTPFNDFNRQTYI